MKKNVVGIDFGTSTSVVRVKEYNGTADDMSLICKPVTMSQDGQVNAPTLVRINGDKHIYGHDAIMAKGKLYSNFKLLLKSNDEADQQLGRELIRDYYSYLYGQYDSQKKVLLKDANAETITKVSYPPQWDDKLRTIILEAASDAGFKNVIGVDEASASVNCILNVKYEELIEAGLIKRGIPSTVLVIDMGAGTTDLAFVRVTAMKGMKTEILGTWPSADSNKIYGGSNMDDRFTAFLKEWITENGIAQAMAENIITSQAPQLKQWKEQTVSAILEDDKAINECSVVENVLMMLGATVDEMPEINRNSFEKIFSPEIDSFVDVIKSAPAELLSKTELVILTGGNSAWYWIEDVLSGKNVNFEDVRLPKIKGNPWKIMKMDLPNETVARGLVYNEVDVYDPEEEVNETEKATSNAVSTVEPASNTTTNSTSVKKSNIFSIRESAEYLFQYYPKMGDPEAMVRLVRNCAITSAVASGVGGLVPGVAIPALMVSCIGATWTMYIKMCGMLGIKMKERLLKVLARIAITNIITNIGVAILGMLIPGASEIESIFLSFVSIYLAGGIFLKTLEQLVIKSSDRISFSDLSEHDIKTAAKSIKVSKTDILDAKKEYECAK